MRDNIADKNYLFLHNSIAHLNQSFHLFQFLLQNYYNNLNNNYNNNNNNNNLNNINNNLVE